MKGAGAATTPRPLVASSSRTVALPYSLGARKNWMLARSHVASSSCSFWRSLEGASSTSLPVVGRDSSAPPDLYVHPEHDAYACRTHESYALFFTIHWY